MANLSSPAAEHDARLIAQARALIGARDYVEMGNVIRAMPGHGHAFDGPAVADSVYPAAFGILADIARCLIATCEREHAATDFTIYRDGARVASVAGYHDARSIVRALSAQTSAAYTVITPAGSPVGSETFANGVSA